MHPEYIGFLLLLFVHINYSISSDGLMSRKLHSLGTAENQ